jgi:hypothetical protein
MDPVHLGRAGNSASRLRLGVLDKPIRLISNDSGHFAHMIHRRHVSAMGIPLRSGTLLRGPVASYSVHRNTKAKQREQRKSGKEEGDLEYMPRHP